MALPEQITTREQQKFEEVSGLVHVRTTAKTTALGQSGTLSAFTGSATTTPASVPSVAGNNILEFFIRCNPDQTASRRLEYSLDGGSNYFRLQPGDADSGTIPLGTSLTQILVRSTASTTLYEIALTVAA